MKAVYRDISESDRGDLAARVLAVQALARRLEVKCVVEPLFYGLNSELWSQRIRLFTTDEKQITPFRELLDSSIWEVYEFIGKCNDEWLKSRHATD